MTVLSTYSVLATHAHRWEWRSSKEVGGVDTQGDLHAAIVDEQGIGSLERDPSPRLGRGYRQMLA